MPRSQLLFALLAMLAFGQLSLANPADLLAVAAVTAASAIVLLLALQSTDRTAPQVRVRALRDRAHRSAFMRTRDPDADGRPRPRAPGQCPAAA